MKEPKKVMEDIPHARPPMKMKLQHDMKMCANEPLHRKPMSDKGHVPMAKQEMMMDY